MTPEQFCIWLSGYADIEDQYSPTEQEWGKIKDKLKTVVIRDPIADLPRNPFDPKMAPPWNPTCYPPWGPNQPLLNPLNYPSTNPIDIKYAIT